MTIKNPVLLGLAQAGKQGQYFGVAVERLVRKVLAQVVSGLADFTLTRQKYKNIASTVRTKPKLINRIGNGIVHVIVTRLFKRPIALLDRKHSP